MEGINVFKLMEGVESSLGDETVENFFNDIKYLGFNANETRKLFLSIAKKKERNAPDDITKLLGLI